MKSIIKSVVLVVALLFASSAFADTYQYTINFTSPVGPASISFTSNSLQPNGLGLGDLSSVTPPTGMFLAAFEAHASSFSTPAYFSAVWDINGAPSLFIDDLLYNNAYGDWALGTYNIQGNFGSDFCCGGQGTDFGSITVTDVTTPEPGSLALLGSGLIGLAGTLRRKFLK